MPAMKDRRSIGGNEQHQILPSGGRGGEFVVGLNLALFPLPMYDHCSETVWTVFDSVAQLAEQWTFNPLVLGSSPSGVTLKSGVSELVSPMYVGHSFCLSPDLQPI
jgi:hypothetical protein